VFALGIPLDRTGPQTGLFGGRFNPIHQMLATGTDALAGQQDWNKLRYADDTLMLCVQGATHWDALGHIFYEDKAYNGHNPKLIDSRGLSVLGIEHSKSKMNGRGVLLDIARFRGVPWLQDGEGIGNDELDACAKAQGVKIGRADFVIIRTGQMERCHAENNWGGYAGGDAPGVKFENCYWCHEKQIAAIITDTWGCEVRPNETKDANQPWHWVVIPAMGLCMGEIFYLKELAEDCAMDKVYEFFFSGPPLIITGGTGSPINPQAIK
jgi:kynurenine formamidase